MLRKLKVEGGILKVGRGTMPSNTIREDQAEHILSQLDRDYWAYAKIPQKSYLRAEDRAEIRQQLVTSMQQAQSALELMDAQPGGLSPALRQFRGKLIVLTTLAEDDLKGQGQR
jgi:hypothetical protein